MNAQWTAIAIAFITLAIGILVHAFGTVWWASKITTTLEGIAKSLSRIDKEFENRDKTMQVAWNKIDDARDRLTKLEAMNQ